MQAFINSPICLESFGAEHVGLGVGMSKGWGIYSASAASGATSGQWNWRGTPWAYEETPDGWCASAEARSGQRIVLPPAETREAAQGGAMMWNGYTYRVRLAARPVDFLNFDTVLEGQPIALAACASAYEAHYRRRAPACLPKMTGFGALLMISGGACGFNAFEEESRRASEQLAAAGLAGIRFATGDGLDHHVIFDLQRIWIVERNGEALRTPSPVPPARPSRPRPFAMAA